MHTSHASAVAKTVFLSRDSHDPKEFLTGEAVVAVCDDALSQRDGPGGSAAGLAVPALPIILDCIDAEVVSGLRAVPRILAVDPLAPPNTLVIMENRRNGNCRDGTPAAAPVTVRHVRCHGGCARLSDEFVKRRQEIRSGDVDNRRISGNFVSATGRMDAARANHQMPMVLQFAQMFAVFLEYDMPFKPGNNCVIMEAATGAGADPERRAKAFLKPLRQCRHVCINYSQVPVATADRVIVAGSDPILELGICMLVIVHGRPLPFHRCFACAPDQDKAERGVLELRRDERRHGCAKARLILNSCLADASIKKSKHV